MATKLKKMRLTSVDLVRAGANQEADICLYKSADPQEAAEGPTEDEMNIIKRFIAYIRGTPTEAKNEPHSHIEKAQAPPEGPADLESIYKSALADSIHSIYTDESLTEVEKKAMTEQSIGQFQERMREVLRDRDDEPEDKDDDHEDDPEEDRYDDIEEIETTVHKYNHNHAADGKFTTSGGGGGGVSWHTTGGAGGKVERDVDIKPGSDIRYIQTSNEKEPSLRSDPDKGKVFGRMVNGQFESLHDSMIRQKIRSGGEVEEHVKELNKLPTKRGVKNVSYEDAKAYATVLNKMPKGTKLSQKTDAGTDKYVRTSDSEIGDNWKHISASSAPSGKEYSMTSLELGRWLAGNGVIALGPIEIDI